MAHITETAPDPTRTSPKVKWGAIVAGVLTIIASAVAAIPTETWATLGKAGVPIGLAVGGGAVALTAYLKRDPAHEVAVVHETPAPAPVGSGSLVLTEDQAVTDDPVELVEADPVEDGPVARLAQQVSWPQHEHGPLSPCGGRGPFRHAQAQQ